MAVVDIRTGEPLVTRRDFGKGLAAIIASGVAPSVSAFGRRGLGLRLRMTGGGGGGDPVEILDWVQGNGYSWVLTDAVFNDVTEHAVIDAVCLGTEANGVNPAGWAGCITAGCQIYGGYKFCLSNFNDRNVAVWYDHGIYVPKPRIGYGSIGFNLEIYKDNHEISSYVVSANVNGNGFQTAEYLGWTTPAEIDAGNICFFGATSPATQGQVFSRTTKFRLKRFSLSNRHDFVPAKKGSLVGVYDNITRTFYSEDGTGKLIYSQNGIIVDRNQ